ncbi:MAG: class I lanthipeptide, partial [Maioricimonas sp. JB045]
MRNSRTGNPLGRVSRSGWPQRVHTPHGCTAAKESPMKKLVLNKETVRSLNGPEMQKVSG